MEGLSRSKGYYCSRYKKFVHHGNQVHRQIYRYQLLYTMVDFFLSGLENGKT